MEHLGEELKSAREAAGLSMRELATRTKISVTALEALERNDFSRLPGGIFGRSFVRAYALEVGVDPDATVARFIDLLEQSEREAGRTPCGPTAGDHAGRPAVSRTPEARVGAAAGGAGPGRDRTGGAGHLARTA